MSKSNSKSVSECPCCYGDCYEGDMLECSANLGHVVCKTCIGNYVIEQLDGKNSAQFECFVAENCNCQLGELVLIKALPKDLKKRVDLAIYMEGIKSVEDIWYVHTSKIGACITFFAIGVNIFLICVCGIDRQHPTYQDMQSVQSHRRH